MRRRNRAYILIFYCIMIVGFPGISGADENKKYTEIKAGFFGAGTASVDDAEFDTKTGLSLGFVFEQEQKNDLITGFAIDLDEIKAKNTDERSLMADFSFIIKKNYPTGNKNISIRPGVAVGLALLDEIGFEEIMRIDKTALLTIRFIGEIAYRIGGTTDCIGEFCIFWSPYGRDNKHDISGGPMPVFRMGVRF